MDELVEQVLSALKTAAPWFTGGLAGAVLTYLLNRRQARKNQPRLSVRVTRVDYSLPSHDEAFRDLQVSYGGTIFTMVQTKIRRR